MIALLLAWGIAMAVIGTIGVLFYDPAGAETPALFYGTAALWVTIATFLFVTRFGRNDPYSARPLPRVSPPAPLLAVAAIFAALGATVGWWLTLIGAGLALVAVAGLVREWLYERRTLKDAAADGPRGER